MKKTKEQKSKNKKGGKSSLKEAIKTALDIMKHPLTKAIIKAFMNDDFDL